MIKVLDCTGTENQTFKLKNKNELQVYKYSNYKI